MSFSRLDGAAIGRCLAQVADRPGDVVEAFFELAEEIVLPNGTGGDGLEVRREGGFSIRLVRGGQAWIASADGFDPRRFGEAIRQVERAAPQASYPEPHLEVVRDDTPPEARELLQFPGRLSRAVRDRRAAFPWRLKVRRHRRRIQVVGPQLVPAPESEVYYSVDAILPWGRWGSVLPDLEDDRVERVAERLVEWFRAREAPPPARGPARIVLGPAAAAILLHEGVAHALECDGPVLGGRPEEAIGRRLASEALSVLDDPGSAPAAVRRATDDEGSAVAQRWLLRDGAVAQPLADRIAAAGSSVLEPGAGRRSSRHAAPVPRSTHLEVPPGDADLEALLEDADLFLPEVSRGRLEPTTGRLELRFPYGYAVSEGRAATAVGPCALGGEASAVLGAIRGIGSEVESTGAGWCAKAGQRLAVWASVPALRLDGVEIEP